VKLRLLSSGSVTKVFAFSCALALTTLGPASCKPKGPDASGEKLVFLDEGKVVTELTLGELESKIPSETFTAFDPYYGRPKTFRALPFDKVLALGFPGKTLAERELLLKAKDGYTVPMRPSLVAEHGSYVAIADVDVPAWEPIGPQRATPAPAYFVWKEPAQQDLESHPRPWQLATIEIMRFEVKFPHTVPTGELETSAAFAGFRIYRERCVRCHAMNREGGRVGPELNVPLNVLEYRPEAQVRAYIKNPLTFRYGNMPPHPDLGEKDLDALIAYFGAMKTRKFDPDAAKNPPAPPVPPALLVPSASASPASSASASASSSSSPSERRSAPTPRAGAEPLPGPSRISEESQ
jgi:mono/diheme cytochrome c family protein